MSLGNGPMRIGRANQEPRRSSTRKLADEDLAFNPADFALRQIRRLLEYTGKGNGFFRVEQIDGNGGLLIMTSFIFIHGRKWRGLDGAGQLPG